MTKNVLIALGSPNDRQHVGDFPRLPDTNYVQSVASAHRTRGTVEEHALDRKWDAIIAGAGMKNALADAYLELCDRERIRAKFPDLHDFEAYVDIDTVLVALPFGDNATSGLSSVLSSSEMPPGYPVATGHLNHLPSAVDFVNGMIEPPEYKTVYLSTDGREESSRVIDKAEAVLKELGVGFNLGWSIDGLNLFAYIDHTQLPAFGLTICSYAGPFKFNIENAEMSTDDVRGAARLMQYAKNAFGPLRYNCFHVGIASGGNLGLYAAKIVARHDPDVKERIREKLRKENTDKYGDFGQLVAL